MKNKYRVNSNLRLSSSATTKILRMDANTIIQEIIKAKFACVNQAHFFFISSGTYVVHHTHLVVVIILFLHLGWDKEN